MWAGFLEEGGAWSSAIKAFPPRGWSLQGERNWPHQTAMGRNSSFVVVVFAAPSIKSRPTYSRPVPTSRPSVFLFNTLMESPSDSSGSFSQSLHYPRVSMNKTGWKLGLVAHAWHPGTWGSKSGWSLVQDHAGLHSETLTQNIKHNCKDNKKTSWGCAFIGLQFRGGGGDTVINKAMAENAIVPDVTVVGQRRG